MEPTTEEHPPSVADLIATLVADQEGVLSRPQALTAGMTSDEIRHRLRSGRWQRLMTGTYAAFTGPVSPEALAWAAVLYAGPGALASHGTAAWLCRLNDEPPATVHVTVPARRRVPAPAGVTVHLSRHATLRQHPARSLSQTTVEATVLDLLDTTRAAEAAVALVIRACQRRLTTAARLRRAAQGRRRLRWRRLLEEVLTEVADGVQSMLERRWLREVERPHGLPHGRRNQAEDTGRGRRYRDVDYEPWGVVVELDGRVAHPDDERHRDMARDNSSLSRRE